MGNIMCLFSLWNRKMYYFYYCYFHSDILETSLNAEFYLLLSSCIFISKRATHKYRVTFFLMCRKIWNVYFIKKKKKRLPYCYQAFSYQCWAQKPKVQTLQHLTAFQAYGDWVFFFSLLNCNLSFFNSFFAFLGLILRVCIYFLCIYSMKCMNTGIYF